jgi:hypothetical protein
VSKVAVCYKRNETRNNVPVPFQTSNGFTSDIIKIFVFILLTQSQFNDIADVLKNGIAFSFDIRFVLQKLFSKLHALFKNTSHFHVLSTATCTSVFRSDEKHAVMQFPKMSKELSLISGVLPLFLELLQIKKTSRE